MNNYISLINKHCEETAFILGAGPSLFFNMSHSLFSSLKKYGIIIVINSAVMACHDFNYFISTDSLSMRWSWWDNVENSKGIKVVRSSWEKYKKRLKGFLFFEPRPTSEDIINPDDLGLCYCNSFSAGIDLAIQMGCKKIFLLGLDHKTKDNKHHFWQFFPKEKQPKQLRPAQGNWDTQKKVFKYSNMAYKALKKFAKYKKCEIYNCNPDSKVDIFNRIKFEKMKKYL